ncbi:hypothetical protein Tco_0371868 [Tanacetum coccineum]
MLSMGELYHLLGRSNTIFLLEINRPPVGQRPCITLGRDVIGKLSIEDKLQLIVIKWALLWFPKTSTRFFDHLSNHHKSSKTFGQRYLLMQGKSLSKQELENSVVELYFVGTEYQLADIFTKPLGRERLEFLMKKLGMQSMSPETLKSWKTNLKSNGGSSSTMTTTAAQQVALDNALVPLEKRVEISKCNMRIDPAKTQKEPTYQVVLDALALTTCYPAFLITADVPEIYMQQFWFTINKKYSTTYKFKIDKKSYRIDMEVFREIFQICPRLSNKDFDELPLDDEIVSFIKELDHKGDIKSVSEVVVDQIAQNLWGMFYKKKVDFVELLWEDFTFQIENRDHKKQEKMYYPRFTKAIIYHFISKEKSISMRNRMFMHTAQDDSILGPMRFISRSDDFQVYGALLPKRITNQQMQDFNTYKTYFATLIIEEEEEPEPAKKAISSKKPTTKRQSAGVQIRDTPGADFESEVPNEPKGKSIDTSEGTGLKPGVLYVSTADSSENENESWGDRVMKQMNKVMMKMNKVTMITNKLMMNGHNLMMKKKKHKMMSTINEELYGDVNVSLIDVEPADKEKDDEEMPLLQEVPHTSPLLTILVSVIPEHIVANPSEIVTTTSSTTISSLMSSVFPYFQQLTPIPTPTTTQAITSTNVAPDSKTLSTFHQRIINLEKDAKELKTIDHSATLLSTIKFEVPNAVKKYFGTSLDDAFYKVLKKHNADIIKEHFVPAEIIERL